MKVCVSKSYGERKVFENFELEIREGEILCVLGASGCGKTTLLNVLAGLVPYEGELRGVPEKAGYIFQEPRLLPNLTVEGNLRYAGGKRERIEEILRKTELWELRDKRPKELSGGEKQRAAIARAFLSDSALLLSDEPFSSLDTALKIRLARVFAELWKEEKRTAVFVTHDIEEAWMLAHRAVVLRNGRIAAEFVLEGSEVPRAYGEGGEMKKRILEALLEE